MAATRLSDSQKIELVARFRAGEGSQALAGAYGCSTATITRAVRAALEPEEYERIKQQGGRRVGAMEPPAEAPVAIASETAPLEPVPAAAPETVDGLSPEELSSGEGLDEAEAPPGVLAIEDADDFGDDEHDDEDDEDADGDLLDEADETRGAAQLSLGLGARAGSAVEVLPLSDASLPSSAYLLVDKTVELQARPLSDFPEFGALAAEEQQRQTLVVFLNPRQAKRQCGRSQRVIKIPDPQVFARTSRFLLAQGISRVLIEGSLYSLSGS